MCFVLLTLFSCSARIDGNLSADGSAVLSVNMSLQRGMTALIQRMFAAGGQSAGQILDGPSIAASMSNAPGITSVTLKNTAPASIEGQVVISQISDFLAATDGSGFITFKQERSGGHCVININRDNGPKMLELLSPEISDYLSALMAPIATGEELSKSEYIELVTSFYNKTISDEIVSSRIRASINFPGNVTNVKGGIFSGRRVNFEILLIDLLVLDEPLIYEVTWTM